MKQILSALTALLLLISCNKDKEVDYSVVIEVQDFYSNQPVPSQTVVMESCITGLMWGHSCDSIQSKVTNQNGRASFSETYKVEFGRGYEFYVKRGNGYMTSLTADPENDSKHIITIKPLTKLYLTIDPTQAFDSLKVFMGISYANSDEINLYPNNLSAYILATPDEENYLHVYAYKNGLLNASKSKQGIYPSLNTTDSLLITIP